MNAPVRELSPWSLRRWIYSILAVFALQVGLIWLLGERLPSPPLPPLCATAIHLAADPWSTKQLTQWPGLEDPTLFALPNLQGFSGAAWLTFTPPHYELTNWSEPPRWLEAEQTHLGQVFSQSVGTNRSPPLLIADKPMPRSVIPDFHVSSFSAPTQSQCRIEGDLAQRALLEPFTLPSWPHPDLLTNSVVQLLVDDQGFTFSTRLLGSSGLLEADQYALRLATQARFRPVPHPHTPAEKSAFFTWGKLVFHWHTVLPSLATNEPTPVPQP